MELLRHTKTEMTPHKKFLVVEDDLIIQPLWDRIIRAIDPNASIRWSTSEEGAEKLIEDKLKSHDHFDFIIADIMLSGKKTGVDLWKKYGDDDSLFLFASSISHRKFEQMVEGSENRFPYMVQKPLDTVECLESLRAMMAYKRAFSSGRSW